MNKVFIDDVGLTTSDLVIAAQQNILYSNNTNISRPVLEIWYSTPEDLWEEESNNWDYSLSDVSLSGV